MGMVSSKTASLVKLRMEKLSSHLSGQSFDDDGVAAAPLGPYCTRTLRANIRGYFRTGLGPAALIFSGTSNFSMFLANFSARSAACRSYADLSFQTLRGLSNSGGTPG